MLPDPGATKQPGQQNYGGSPAGLVSSTSSKLSHFLHQGVSPDGGRAVLPDSRTSVNSAYVACLHCLLSTLGCQKSCQTHPTYHLNFIPLLIKEGPTWN